jgi:hypothetical protein
MESYQSYPSSFEPTSDFLSPPNSVYYNAYSLHYIFSARAFFYDNCRYTTQVSYKDLVYSRSEIFCKYAFHGLARVMSSVVVKFHSYFLLFTSESVVYGIIIILQQNLCIHQCYGSDLGSLLYDVLVEVSRIYSDEIFGFYSKIMYPSSTNSSIPDFGFVFNGATENFHHKINMLIGPDFLPNLTDNPPFQTHLMQIYEKQIPYQALPLKGISLMEANTYLATNIPRLIAGNPMIIQFPELNRKTCIMIHILGTIFYRIKVGKIDNFLVSPYHKQEVVSLLPIHFSIPDLF